MALLNLKLTKRGILNIGTTCYFNAAIQAIITERILIALKQLQTHNKFSEWLKNFDYTSSHVLSLFHDTDFGKSFTTGTQSDSFDCFQILIDKMPDEIKNIAVYNYYPRHICDNGHIKIFNEGKLIPNYALFTTIHNFISCMKGSTPEIRGELVYHRLLCNIDKTEINCEICKKEMIEEKITKELPRFLCIRFSGQDEKNQSDHESVSILPFRLNNYLYYPVSIVYHSSGVASGGGHYHAVVLRTENSESDDLNYYLINDDRIHRMGETRPVTKRGIQYVIYEIH